MGQSYQRGMRSSPRLLSLDSLRVNNAEQLCGLLNPLCLEPLQSKARQCWDEVHKDCWRDCQLGSSNSNVADQHGVSTLVHGSAITFGHRGTFQPLAPSGIGLGALVRF